MRGLTSQRGAEQHPVCCRLKWREKFNLNIDKASLIRQLLLKRGTGRGGFWVGQLFTASTLASPFTTETAGCNRGLSALSLCHWSERTGVSDA